MEHIAHFRGPNADNQSPRTSSGLANPFPKDAKWTCRDWSSEPVNGGKYGLIRCILVVTVTASLPSPYYTLANSLAALLTACLLSSSRLLLRRQLHQVRPASRVLFLQPQAWIASVCRTYSSNTLRLLILTESCESSWGCTQRFSD